MSKWKSYKDRKVTEPTLDKLGHEVHPSWGVIVVSRSSASPPGKALFQSDIRHQHYISMKIQRASRGRDLHTDWVHGTGESLIEINMSMAQWAAMVSSFGIGGGTPVTIDWLADEGAVDEAPFGSRLAVTAAEVAERAADPADEVRKACEDVTKALDELDALGRVPKAVREAVFHLRCMVDNLPANMKFSADQLTNHVEKTVAKVQADIEAMVRSIAVNAGLERGDADAVARALGAHPEQQAPPARKMLKAPKK